MAYQTRSSPSLPSIPSQAVPSISISRRKPPISLKSNRSSNKSSTPNEALPIPASTTTLFDYSGRPVKVSRRKFSSLDDNTRVQRSQSVPTQSIKEYLPPINNDKRFNQNQSQNRSVSSAPRLPSKEVTHLPPFTNFATPLPDRPSNPHQFRGSLSVRERKPVFPQSETRGAYQIGPRESSAGEGAFKSVSNIKSERTNYGGRKQQSEEILTRRSARLNGDYESYKMNPSRSELSLIEQKRVQWAKEKEELNGLWSPWGRQSETSTITSKQEPQIPLQMQASYPPPTNVLSSSYVGNLGSPTYSQSHSECYLPPINSTIAQQPRQKAKVWNNVEFEQEDYRYENQHSHDGHRPSIPTAKGVAHPHPRKASLPNYMYEGGGDAHYNNYQHQQMIHQQHNKLVANQVDEWGQVSLEEDNFTSGYYSSENNNAEEIGGERGGGKVILKPTSRERTYEEEVTVQKAIAIKKDKNGNSPGKVVTHKIYTQNGEVFEGFEQEVIVNNMTVSMNEKGQAERQTLPRNHAMRSSLTIGVDASQMDAYYEDGRRNKEQWLNELEKQREEQRYRKMMEKEERRPRWGDRGIGVGHFWEPNAENSHLPAPPQTSRSNKGLTRSESHNGGESYNQANHQYHHPGQSHTPPAWLERSLTRMQSSKSQPSLHEPDYNEMGYPNAGNSLAPNSQQLTSRSLNQSAIDLRNVAGYCSPTGELERSFVRGQNVPIDPDTLAEREKKRQANQEHLEALKKQIEERQQLQKEEKERRQQEDREQEMRIAKQREIELQRLEMEKRGRIPVNGDMPNSIEDTGSTIDLSCGEKAQKMTSIMDTATNHPVRDPGEEKDIEIVQRQSVLVGGGGGTESESKTESSSATSVTQRENFRASRQDQSVMTDTSDPNFERTLTPSMQRSRSLSISRSREFGTQTELSDGSSVTESSSESGKNSSKNRSHNSLLDKKAKEGKKQKESKKSDEQRPRWGSNPVKKQYIKQSEKDPNYISRMKRRQERLKRMEEERSARGDTDDSDIPFHRIRSRRNNESVKGIKPMKAFPMGKVEKEAGPAQVSKASQKSSRSNEYSPRQVPGMKPAKSESQLSPRQQAQLLDRNFGSVAGLNVMGTSEESSGFSTPFLPRRETLGSGSTESGSGTTGSGSGIQSPDLVYQSHPYRTNRAKEERKFTKITNGRDVIVGNMKVKGEFRSDLKGFIHQQEFDEMPVKSAKVQSNFEEELAKAQEKAQIVRERRVSNATLKKQQRNQSSSPTRKSKSKSPVKAEKILRRKANEKPEIRGGTAVLESTTLPGRLPIVSARKEAAPVPPQTRPTSPPVPALLKKMQMGLQPDETGRISSLPTEFPDILAPLPQIPMRLASPLNPPSPTSRISSATSATSSTSAGKIDIDIAVMPRRNPEVRKLFEAAEERIKQRQLTAIKTSRNGPQDSARSRRSFEADLGNISINLEPISLYPNGIDHDEGLDKFEYESARLSIRSSYGPSPRPPPTARTDSARHEAFIANILNRKEVKEQLSARESELSEKGIIEFSIRLPSNSSGDDFLEEYKDPLLTERRRNTAQWLYGGQSQVPQKQAILTNLASLKKGLSLEEQEWKVKHSDSES